MSARPFLLITNDDGIDAPGIRHLWEAARRIGDVAVVAPRGEKSGSGLSITWTKPLLIEEQMWEETPAWRVTGTPADCVKMGLSMLLKRRPHLILSGVNRGSNSGKTVLYSGTVGGVIEGALRGIPGVAFSYSDKNPPPAATAVPHLISLIQYAVESPPAAGTFFNVTLPAELKHGVKGIRFASQGRGYWTESPERRVHPDGAPYYWLGGKWTPAEEAEDSDVRLSDEGYIAVVPIRVDDLTDRAALAARKADEGRFAALKELELDLTP